MPTAFTSFVFNVLTPGIYTTRGEKITRIQAANQQFSVRVQKLLVINWHFSVVGGLKLINNG